MFLTCILGKCMKYMIVSSMSQPIWTTIQFLIRHNMALGTPIS